MAEARGRWFLREWRKDRGYSQERLAEMVSSSKGYIADLEAGKRRYNQDLLEGLAIALRCTPADLINRPPDAPAGIQVDGLAPEQVRLVENMVEQLKRTGTGG